MSSYRWYVYFDEHKRATAIGIRYLSSGVGTAVAFFAGGAIFEAHGWRWAFLAAGRPGLCEQTGNANAARLHLYATSGGF